MLVSALRASTITKGCVDQKGFSDALEVIFLGSNLRGSLYFFPRESITRVDVHMSVSLITSVFNIQFNVIIK